MNLVGAHIGSYVVERELGSGGTGTVYLCRHTLIEREVAVKVLHDDGARDPDQVARFFQEAKAAAEIGHPNIIVIIDYGTLQLAAGPRTYLMMESLDGESLDKRLHRGGLSLDDIAHILSQIVSALAACHGHGVIHRDLKPANIFLCRRSFDPLFVKLLDFGTAKLTAPLPGARRTQYGLVIGTPAYMSPEQCDGRGAIDHRSDVYSLGVVIYEMLTGTLPFGGDLADMLRGHLTQAPEPPSQRNPQIPHEWEALCLRMMEKTREARFQSVSEVAQAIDDLRGHAAFYDAYRTQRSQTGHSGHTMIAPATAGGEDRPTLRGMTGAHAAVAPITGAHAAVAPTTGAHAAIAPEPSGELAAAAPITGSHAAIAAPTITGSHQAVAPAVTGSQDAVAASTGSTSYGAATPHAACTALVTDPRCAGFARTLMVRPTGRWYEVSELCQTGGVAAPAAMPFDLFVAWLEHPYPDANLASAVFLSLRTGWSTVVLCARERW